MEVSKYTNKRVAILGYGIEGRSAHNFFVQHGCQADVFDEHPSDEQPENTTIGPVEEWKIDDYDLVVRAPGLALHRIQTTTEITSLTKVFFELCPAKIIGVTGTKGKGTTSSLIAGILSEAGQTTHLLGNIGLPALDVLNDIQPGDIVIYELSSFQLWDLDKSPHISVVLMIEPEHLDVHTDVDDYLRAKQNIAKHQSSSDTTIFHPFNELSEKVAMVGVGIKKKYMSNETARINLGELYYGNQKIMPTSDFGLIGPHNRENICAATTAVWEISQDASAIEKGIREFKGLEHRLEFVRELGGVKFYNDSFATTPGATIAAINSFDNPEIIILGGSDKGADYSDLAEAISVKPNIRQILLIGKMADKINDSLSSFGYESAVKVDGDMKAIIQKAQTIAQKDDVVLLSPACASFDMFESYKQRGQIFKKIVEEL